MCDASEHDSKGRQGIGQDSVESRAKSWRHGECVVLIFIGRGAPLRNTLLTPNATKFAMQAVKR